MKSGEFEYVICANHISIGSSKYRCGFSFVDEWLCPLELYSSHSLLHFVCFTFVFWWLKSFLNCSQALFGFFFVCFNLVFSTKDDIVWSLLDCQT